MRNRLAVRLSAAMLLSPLCAQQFQFMPYATRVPESFVPGTTSVFGGFAVGDYSGDGRPDVFVCEGVGNRLAERTSTGWTNRAMPAIADSHRPYLRDLDGDGDLDIVFGPRLGGATNTLRLVRNEASGPVFVTLPVAIASVRLQGLAIGDVDGDGDLDLVGAAVPQSGPAIGLLRNTGQVQFAADFAAMPATGVPYGLWPTLVDADGDGDLDVFASTAGAGFVLLTNNGAGVFANASAQLPATRIGHVMSCAGDFDGDGRTDFAATWWNGDLDVLWGGAAGWTFQPGVVTGLGARWLTAADFDGDGDLDLAAEQPNGFDLLRNLGARSFAREVVVAEPVSAFGIGDVDADGAQDVLFTTVASRGIVRCRFRGVDEVADAALTAGVRIDGIVGRLHAPVAGDVDGDGRIDLLVPAAGGMAVYHGHGDDTYDIVRLPAVVAGQGPNEHWRLADLDGDGDPDLVACADTGMRIFGNDGTGTFAPAGGDTQGANALDGSRLADLDGDGDLDILRWTLQGLELTRNLGGLAFAPSVLVFASLTPRQAFEVGDFDRDGDLDIATSMAVVSGGSIVLENDGTGNLTIAVGMQLALGSPRRSLVATDVDGDGDLDLLAAFASPVPGISLFRNNGAGVFVDASAGNVPTLGIVGSNLVCGDFDNDGDPDLFATEEVAGQQRILLDNDGTGRFTNASAARLSGSALPSVTQWFGQASDLDGDGDLDLLLGNHTLTSIAATQMVLVNNLRQLRSVVAPHLGATAQFDLLTAPGFGPSGLGVLAAAFALAPVPLPVPGFAGDLQIDPGTLQFVATVPTSGFGASTAFLAVPNQPALAGLGVWLQAAVLPTAGQSGVTGAVFERLLR